MTDVEAVIAVATATRDLMADGDLGAVALAGDELMVSPDYWDNPSAFERIVADRAMAAGARSAIFSVPLFVRDLEGGRTFRAPVGEQDDSHEELFILAVDVDSGLDMIRCRVTRQDGVPVLGDIERYDAEGRLDHQAPGFLLVNVMAAHA